jgi:hypothetical protein
MQFYDAFKSQPGPGESMPDGSVALSVVPTQAQQDLGFKEFDSSIPNLNEMLLICYLCSKAKFDRTDVPLKQRTVIADATETGLFSFASSALTDCDAVCAPVC